MAEEHSLPGWPKKRLVWDVRRHLWHYGIRPVRDELWRATWAWAERVASSYWRTNWPMPSEIATQYILLLLLDMKRCYALRLPYRAADYLPTEVAALLPLAQQPALLAIAGEAEKRPRKAQPRRQKKQGQRQDASLMAGRAPMRTISRDQALRRRPAVTADDDKRQWSEYRINHDE